MKIQQLLDCITAYYLKSGDFNGIPCYEIPHFKKEDLISLIEKDLVRVLSEDDDINIHINRLNLFATKDKQIQTIQKSCSYVVYPTTKHLESVNTGEVKPFTAMLAQGIEQFRILYFAVDVLELYTNDPRYAIWDSGYRGNIYVQADDVENMDDLHSEYIKDFGIAYPKKPPHDRDRAIGVFLRDLSKLNFEAQCKWRGFLLRNQDEFLVNSGFIKNLLYGDWNTGYWIFDALLDEIKLINSMCSSIGIPNLFRKEYSRDEHELLGYRIILIPSLKNYYEFVSALEKIVVNNLNHDAFQHNISGIKAIERKKPDGTLKGSIEMLEDWFSLNYFSTRPENFEKFKKHISGTFRLVRKIRQTPAHELYSNKHDKQLYRKQNELIQEVYFTLRDLRMMFSTHPYARTVLIPEELQHHDYLCLY